MKKKKKTVFLKNIPSDTSDLISVATNQAMVS